MFDYGDEDPVKMMGFYKKKSPNEAVEATKPQISRTFICDRQMRICCKNLKMVEAAHR